VCIQGGGVGGVGVIDGSWVVWISRSVCRLAFLRGAAEHGYRRRHDRDGRTISRRGPVIVIKGPTRRAYRLICCPRGHLHPDIERFNPSYSSRCFGAFICFSLETILYVAWDAYREVLVYSAICSLLVSRILYEQLPDP